uniref:myelin and lymphocyte protein-like n=1 Tax=Monopterus albus TaxID=43700 RepID=UPI0009B3A810|nr:myelin and lymphocyte protein-like [Monopterus albus]
MAEIYTVEPGVPVYGGLVWTLVATLIGTLATLATSSFLTDCLFGWVMFVSVFCFVFTTLWILLFLCGCNQSSIWPTLDVFYHFVAVLFYLSASVILAYFTIGIGLGPSNVVILKIYRLAISAVVMSFLATLFYFLHAIFSAIRWKRS